MASRPRFYQPELDALRFFAFFCVFFTHARIHSPAVRRFQEMGSYGMSVFFVLSAYLIVTILLREKEATGTVDLKRFLVRRILRIWPLYFAVLIGAFILGRFWPVAYIPLRGLLAFSLLAGNVYVLQYGWVLGPSNALWSLSVEEQFYLGIPLLSRVSNRRVMAAVFAATLLLSYVVILFRAHSVASPTSQLWPNSFVEFQFFAAGGLLALFTQHRTWRLSLLTRTSLAAFGLLLWTCAALRFAVDGTTPQSAAHLCAGYLLVLLGTTAIFLAILNISARIPAWLIYLGKVSYGLYLFHSFFFYLLRDAPPAWLPNSVRDHTSVNLLLAMAGSIALAALSYRYFEQPILRFKQRFETVRTRVA